jgi:hypothetical protein
VYLLHCTWRCNILCSKYDMRMNEWNRHALFLSWNGRNRYLHSSLLKIWDFFHSCERNSVSFHSFRYAPLVKRRNFSHSWKKSQIFNRDSCKNLLLLFEYRYLYSKCSYIVSLYRFLAHLTQRYCHHLVSVVRPLTFSYFNLLLWNNWAKWNQTWQKAFI